jgi:hypothetical protein
VRVVGVARERFCFRRFDARAKRRVVPRSNSNDVSAIQLDEQFWPKIEEGITNCDSFFVVITAASEWAKREVEFARGLSKKVIPIWPRTSVDSTAQKWVNSNSSSRLHRMTSPACGKSECGNLHRD